MSEGIVRVPINGTMDLHSFSPKDIIPLLNEYLYSCYEAGILEGKIIHGKGIGTQKRIVEETLRKNSLVIDFGSGDENSGNWGVTKFSLKRHARKLS